MYQHESATGIHIFPILSPLPSSLLPPHTIPLGQDGEHMYTCVYLWRIHFDIWQNQYNIVKLKNKIKFKKFRYKRSKFRGAMSNGDSS